MSMPGISLRTRRLLGTGYWVAALVFSLLTAIVSCGTAVKHSPIRWTDMNPLFQENNVIAVNIGDEIDFICPTISQGSSSPSRLEYYVIYQVTQEEYEGCQVINLGQAQITKEVINCSKPYEANRRFRLQFNILSPIGNDFDFRPGTDYFYLTTSSGDITGIDLRKDGACREKNMKITIKVSERATSSPPSSSLPVPVTSSTRRTTSTTTRRTSRTTSRRATTRRTTPTRSSTRTTSSTTVSTTRTTSQAVATSRSTHASESSTSGASGVVGDSSGCALRLSSMLLVSCWLGLCLLKS